MIMVMRNYSNRSVSNTKHFKTAYNTFEYIIRTCIRSLNHALQDFGHGCPLCVGGRCHSVDWISVWCWIYFAAAEARRYELLVLFCCYYLRQGLNSGMYCDDSYSDACNIVCCCSHSSVLTVVFQQRRICFGFREPQSCYDQRSLEKPVISFPRTDWVKDDDEIEKTGCAVCIHSTLYT